MEDHSHSFSLSLSVSLPVSLYVSHCHKEVVHVIQGSKAESKGSQTAPVEVFVCRDAMPGARIQRATGLESLKSGVSNGTADFAP